MTRRLAPLLPLLATLLIASCGGSSRVVTERTYADSLLERLADSYATTPQLTMNGQMTISGMGVTLWFDAISQSYDSLRVNLIGPFALPVGVLSATPESFLFLNAQEGEAVVGNSDRETFQQILMISLGFQEMAALLRGEVPMIPARGDYRAETHDDVVTYTYQRTGMTESFTIDPSSLAVTSFSRYMESPQSRYEEISITYRDFLQVGGRSFPKKGSVRMMNGEQSLTIAIDKVRAGVDEGRQFAVDIPPGVPTRRL